jgi:predicted NAD/FAD-binding protein
MPIPWRATIIQIRLFSLHQTRNLIADVFSILIDCMNHLQHIDENSNGPVLVTLNPPFEPRAELVVDQTSYEHPVMSAQVGHLNFSYFFP